MKIAPILTHLQAAATGYLDISGAVELAEVGDRLPRLPALYIVPLTEDRTAGRQAGHLRQRITWTIAAISVVRNVRGETGAESFDELHDLRQQLIAAMVDFRHPDGTNNAVPVSARLSDLSDRILIYEDVFTFDGVESHEVSAP